MGRKPAEEYGVPRAAGTFRGRRSKIWRADVEGAAEIGQEPVASFIASEVERDSDVRIALQGPWGSGKTRILKLVRDRIKQLEGEDIVVAWYDPWKYSPDETVLRRTLLNCIADAVEDQCPGCADEVSRDRFHGPVERINKIPMEEREEGIEEAVSDFWFLLRSKWRFYGIFGAVWTGLFLLALGFQEALPTVGTAPAIFVGTAGAALLASVVEDAVQAIQVVEISPYVRSTLPKLDQIDQFEREYGGVLRCLSEQEKNLVVLVDDLDRCRDDEMRTVMSGLATYLETPHEREDGHAAFVVAIDEPRLLEALKENGKRPRRDNILQKHFHLVVPVPIPTHESLTAVLDATLDELDWQVGHQTRKRMANLIAVHGDSNLRVLRSTVAEAFTMERYYQEVLEPQGIKVAEQLIEDPLLRFRIALIREVSDSEDLRQFLSNPRMWLGKRSWPKGIPRNLFDLSPQFTRGELDPRPLLGLSPEVTTIAAYPETDQVIEELRSGNYERVQSLLEGYPSETLISFVSILLSAQIPDDPQESALYLTGLISIMDDARPALDGRDLQLFERVIRYLREVPAGKLAKPQYEKWVQVASEIGEEALAILVQKDIPLLQKDQPQVLNALLVRAENGEVDAEFALSTHARVLGKGNWQRLHPVATALIRAEQLGRCRELHELQIRCMKQWNYDQNPKVPPDDLYTEGLIRGMEPGLRREAAAAYQVAANRNEPEAREFVSRVAEAGWPTERRDATDSGNESDD